MMRSRHGMIVWIALGCLMVASVGAFMLAGVSQTSLRQLGLVRGETDLRWTAQAVIASFGNHLKMKPWPRRFYADGSATEYQEAFTYQGRACTLWARDSMRAGVVQTGTTDVFVRVADQDVVVGTFQRLRITPAPATNPKVLHVLRELTVREDFQDQAVRDRILADLAADEKTDAENTAEADVIGRAVEKVAANDVSPEQALAAARAARSEAQDERKFQDTLARGRDLVDAARFSDAISVYQEALSMANASSSAQRPQRAMAAQLNLARAQYALGLTSSDPARASLLGEASAGLEALVRDLGSGCAGPTAAYQLAQVKMARKSSKSQTPGERAQTRDQIGRELDAMLRSIVSDPQGTAFEGGSVPVSDLASQFLTTWSSALAYADTFLQLIFIPLPLPFAGPPTPILFPVQSRILVTDDLCKNVRPITTAGIRFPVAWLKDGSALLGMEYDTTPGGAVILMDRTGYILGRYPGLDLHPTMASAGLTLTPAGDQFVCIARGPGGREQCYWLQDLRGGPPRRLLGPFEPSLWCDFDPIVFSHDGRYAAFYDPRAGVRISLTDEFLGGAAGGGRIVFPVVPERGQEPGMFWLKNSDGNPYLLVFTAPGDDRPEKGSLLLFEAMTGTRYTSPPFPQGFTPQLAFAAADRQRVTLVDTSFSTGATIDFGPAGFTGGFATQPLEQGPFAFQPGRGPGNTLYVAGKLSRPGIWVWDLGGQGQTQLSLPIDPGPTDKHGLTHPVSY